MQLTSRSNLCFQATSGALSCFIHEMLILRRFIQSRTISLVLDRYMAIVKPFKYITFMTRSRVIQVITFCWIVSFTLVAFKTALRLCCENPLTSIVAVVVLMISMEIFPCVLQILCFVSMLIHIWKQDRSARTLGRISFKTRNETSARYGRKSSKEIQLLCLCDLAHEIHR